MSELADTLVNERLKQIDDMLTHYRDVQDTLEHGGMGSGDLGIGYMELPQVWKHSGYPTLEKLLRGLKQRFESEERFHPYWHVREWYFRCAMVRRPIYETRGVTRDGKPVFRLDAKGNPVQRYVKGVPQVQMVRERYLGLAEEKPNGPRQVRRALEWLSAAWPLTARFQPERVSEIADRLERLKKVA